MEQIIINRAAGGALPLYSNSIATKITKAEQRWSLLSENVVQMTVECAQPIEFLIGDWITVFGSKYTLNTLPQADKTGERRFVYELLFESVQYDLLKVQYFNTDGTGLSFGGDFPLMGDIRRFVEVLVTNAVRVFGSGSWEIGDYPDTDFRNLTFSNENCLSVLQRVCEEFSQEFEITSVAGVNTIHIRKAGQVLPNTFQYGHGRGLYQLTRQTVSNKNIITRLYAFGSTKNLKSGYRNYSTRLKLPGDDLSFIEDAAAKTAFGHIEASKTFDEVYPHRTGTISALGSDVYSFVDSSMDFDLNETESGNTKYLIPGTSAKIHFNSGPLAGYEFELFKYTHSEKKFELVPYKDERGQQFPAEDTAAFQMAVGDKYVILDISMPDSYITAAENELLEKAEEYLAQNSQPRVQYSLQIDELYLLNQAGTGSIVNFFTPGDYLQVKDTDIAVDKSIRVKAFNRNILRPYQYTLELTDVVEVSILQRVIAETTDLAKIVQINNLTNPARAKNGWRTTQELLNMVFDQSGYFDTTNIRPHSIETNMLAVGNINQQFVLDVIIEANFEGNYQVVKTSAGVLAHYTIAEDIRTWNMAGATVTLTSPSAYYIYARCEKTGTAGSVVFSTDQIKTDQDGTYYHFLIGVLHSPDSDVRWISLTYGTTSINGRFIKTGRVQSADGQTYFDLDEGRIVGAIQFGKTTEATVIDEGVVASGSIILGEGGNEKAGITGLGEPDTSIRMWAGANFSNREHAPFRVNQAGEVVARKRIELQDQTETGQAGICGANTSGDGDVRIWAGETYANRETAPFNVKKDGSIKATKGTIGGLTIQGNNLVNDFSNDAAVIMRNDAAGTFMGIGTNVLPGSSGLRALARIENKEANALGTNYGAIFKASGALENFAIYNDEGTLFTKEGQLNGRRAYTGTHGNVTINIEAWKYDYISIFANVNPVWIELTSLTDSKIADGKEITIMALNDAIGLTLRNTIRGNASVGIAGGVAMTIFFCQGYWYIKSTYDNNW